MSTLNEQQLLTCAKQMESLKGVLACKICLEKPTSARLCNDCCAVFCFKCINKWIDNNKRTCPKCSRSKSLDDFVNLLWAEDLTKNWDKEPCIEGNQTYSNDNNRQREEIEYLHRELEKLRQDNNRQKQELSNMRKELDDTEIVPSYDATEFTLRDFSNRRVRDDTAYSDLLRSGGLEWKLHIDSNGVGDAKGTFLSVFLELVSGADRPVKVQCRIEMKHQQSLDPAKSKILESIHEFQQGKPWGQREFFLLDSLASKGYLVQDSLHFTFQVRPVTILEGYLDLKSRIEDAEIVPAYDEAQFTLRDFSKRKERDDVAYSDTLHSAGLQWKLKVDTNGYGDDKGTFLTVALYLVSGADRPMKVQYRIQMINCKSTDPGSNKVYDHIGVFEPGKGKGPCKFFRLDRLESDGFLVQDSLQFKFEVRPVTISEGYYELKSRIEDAQMVLSCDTKEFVVKEVSKLRADNQRVHSDALQAFGMTWKLRVFPGGAGEAKGRYLSAFVYLESGLVVGSAKFHYQIEMLQQNTSSSGGSKMYENVYEFSSGETIGKLEFFPLKYLESQGYLVKDTLRFKFSVKPTALSDQIRLLQHHNKSLQR